MAHDWSLRGTRAGTVGFSLRGEVLVKRTVLALGLAAVMVACGGSRLFAQASATTSTRVAIVNIGLVFTKYDKARAYKDQMKKLVDPYQLEGETLKKEMLAWTEAMKDPKFDPKDRDRYEQGVRGNQRKLEDLEVLVRKLVGTTQEEQIINLYKEVHRAIEAHARANGIHVVLGYGEQIDGDIYAFANINRKMQGMDLGSCNPLFHVPGVDISQQVADTLNAAFRAAGPSASGVTTVSGTAPSKQK
jgi:Skp family chaperone for outer membrane proteins